MALRQDMMTADRWINGLRTALFVGGMLMLLGLLGWYVAGTAGLVVLTGLFVFSSSLIGKVPPRLILRMQGARPLNSFEHPTVHRLAKWLARRAGLSNVPDIYLLPGPVQNALTTGTESSAAIGITAGILKGFSARELAGILAHEISHVRNRDTLIMGLAAATGRFTSALSQFGLLLLLINLPLVMMGSVSVPLPLILLLLFAPTVNTILTLGLSRTREYEADLMAAGLTGDPQGLASALQRLELTRKPWWMKLLFPMRRELETAWLRTHPPTEERIRRLLELEQTEETPPPPRRPERHDMFYVHPPIMSRS